MVNSVKESLSRKEVFRTSCPHVAHKPCSIVSSRVRGESIRLLRNASIAGALFVAFIMYIIPHFGLRVKRVDGFIFNRRKCLSILDLGLAPGQKICNIVRGKG